MDHDTDDEWDPPSDAEEQFFDDGYCPEAMQVANADEISGNRPVIKTDMDRPCAKVFSMPELMENILLMVADAAVDGANASSTPRLEPIQTLTGLPRVSSDFFQAMKTTKLARSIRSWQHENQEVVADRGKFMQICQLVGVENEYNTIAAINYSTAPRLDLTFSPGPKVEAKHARCPVFWLFQHLIEKKNPQYRIDADAGSTGILSGGISSGGTHTAPLYPPVLAAYYTANSPEDDDDEEEDEEDKIRVDPMPGTLAITIPKFYLNTNSLQGPTRMLNTFLKSNMAGEKATWRNIQAVNGDKLTISFDNVSARYDGSSKRLHYKVRLTFDRDATLGEVFQQYHDFVKRSREEHWKLSQHKDARIHGYTHPAFKP